MIRPAKRTLFTTGFIIATNLFPIAGVFLFGWDLSSVLLLYWSENLILLFFTFLRILLAGKPAGQSIPKANIPLAIFFLIHFGMFTMVHGFFVQMLVGGFTSSLDPLDLVGLLKLVIPSIWQGFLVLFATHAVSFFLHYLVAGELQHTTARKEMSRPYARVIVLHITILAGAFALSAFGGFSIQNGPTGLLAQIVPTILIVLKTMVETLRHLGLHGKDYPGEPLGDVA